VVTRPTGRQRGRPTVALRDDPLVYELALSEALRRGLRVSHQRARILAVMALRAKETDGGDNLPRALLRKRDETGGEILYFHISTLRGDVYEKDPSKRIQAVNTLGRKLKRGIGEADNDYLTKLSALFFVALFGKGSLERRAIGIALLSQEIDETAFGAALIAAMLTRRPPVAI
jgi:hypothetical protein